MLMLVMADNLLQLFVFWEAVGLCSYLLIGHWYERPSACAAATKAFLVNRVGDFGFLLGLFLVWYSFGSLDYATMFAQAQALASKTMNVARTLRRDMGCVSDDDDLPSAVYRSGRKIRAGPVTRVAPRCHGRTNADLRLDPCRYHGDGRGLHGRAIVAAL